MPEKRDTAAAMDTPLGLWLLARGATEAPGQARELWWRRTESYDRPDESSHYLAEVAMCAMLVGAIHDAHPDVLRDRKFTKLTSDIAKATGLTSTTVANLLNGKRWGRFDTWARVVVAAGADLSGAYNDSLAQLVETEAQRAKRTPTEQQKKNLQVGRPAQRPHRQADN